MIELFKIIKRYINESACVPHLEFIELSKNYLVTARGKKIQTFSASLSL